MIKAWNRCMKRLGNIVINVMCGTIGFVAMCLIERAIVLFIF